MIEANQHLQAIRHSLAHLLAATVVEMYPGAKNAIGPAIENGFYQDFEVSAPLTEADLPKIEKKMRQMLQKWDRFERREVGIDEARQQFAWNPYKLELAEEFAQGDKQLTFYTSGDFVDLCRGGHVDSAREINPNAFKLTKVSGAYWRGDQNKQQLQRVYGVAFETKEELDAYLQQQEEAKKRDHRKLGQELGLFFFHETAPGMPYWLPNGVVLYNELVNFWREEHQKRGYQEIVSPLLNKSDLYVTSGHYDHYWEGMFTAQTEENEEYGMKAMNCPNAMIVYKHYPRSYRELPLRLSDTDTLHRFEKSGTLNGLLRVREFRQDDAHIFVTQDQIKEEYQRIFEITERFYAIFGMQYSFRLGTRPDKFMGEEALWDQAEATLKEILEESGKEYIIEEGDGAFYGPKIDILMKDALGRPWQMGTIQLDFQQPLRFKLAYTDKDGLEKTPIAIHRVIYGSLERFIGILIEHVAGRFPVWLSPEQLRIATVNQQPATLELAEKIARLAREASVRVVCDNENESVGKKIRSAELLKVPYIVVIGEKEVEQGRITPRTRGDFAQTDVAMTPEELIAVIAKRVKSRT